MAGDAERAGQAMHAHLEHAGLTFMQHTARATGGAGARAIPGSAVFVEPPVRFELTTCSLRGNCSTPELRWRGEM